MQIFTDKPNHRQPTYVKRDNTGKSQNLYQTNCYGTVIDPRPLQNVTKTYIDPKNENLILANRYNKAYNPNQDDTLYDILNSKTFNDNLQLRLYEFLDKHYPESTLPKHNPYNDSEFQRNCAHLSKQFLALVTLFGLSVVGMNFSIYRNMSQNAKQSLEIKNNLKVKTLELCTKVTGQSQSENTFSQSQIQKCLESITFEPLFREKYGDQKTVSGSIYALTKCLKTTDNQNKEIIKQAKQTIPDLSSVSPAYNQCLF